MGEKKTIKSVSKAFEIIELISNSKEGLGSTELSELLGLNISSIQHILTTLKEENILRQSKSNKKYKLSSKVIYLGQKAKLQNDLFEKIKPFLHKIAEKTGETTSLVEFDKTNIVYVAQEESNHSIRMFVELGKKAPVYCSGAGKALLAYSSEFMKNTLIPKISFDRYTQYTIDSKKNFIKELDKIKLQGYAYDMEERELGVRCVAIPIIHDKQEPQYAISVSGPTHRMTPEKMLEVKDIIKAIIKEILNNNLI